MGAIVTNLYSNGMTCLYKISLMKWDCNLVGEIEQQ